MSDDENIHKAETAPLIFPVELELARRRLEECKQTVALYSEERDMIKAALSKVVPAGLLIGQVEALIERYNAAVVELRRRH